MSEPTLKPCPDCGLEVSRRANVCPKCGCPLPPLGRPRGVWVISVFYALSDALIFGGAIKMTGAQEAYFASLTGVDWVFSLAIGGIALSAAVCLFLLRRVAVALFSVDLALNIGFTAFHAMRTNWIEAIGGAGLVGAVFAWLILVAVVLYARRLAQRGVLS